MHFFVGDLVTRRSYNNDVVFKIVEIIDNIYSLKGVNIRIYADSDEDDLEKVDGDDRDENDGYFAKMSDYLDHDKNYFYIPGKILHIDGDDEYLKRCINFYKKCNIMAVGIRIFEADIADKIEEYLEAVSPDILVITGHDAYFKNKEKEELRSYRNSENFFNAVKRARVYEKSYDKLIIIAGACQSNYEKLIEAGANFASSPKRVNIHTLDPALVSASIALTNKSDFISVLNIVSKTKAKEKGLGGLRTNGVMYVGYPR